MRSRCVDRYNASAMAARMSAADIIGARAQPPNGAWRALVANTGRLKQTHRRKRRTDHDLWSATRPSSAGSLVADSLVADSHVDKRPTSIVAKSRVGFRVTISDRQNTFRPSGITCLIEANGLIELTAFGGEWKTHNPRSILINHTVYRAH